MKSLFFYETEIGIISITEENNYITDISFVKDEVDKKIPLIETPLLKEAAVQIREYLNGKRKLFNLPISPSGTEFRQKVWTALQTVPYGETRSYKEIAVQICNENACRAVGMANNKNPLPIIIPCHRVVGSNGKLVGYAGGLDIKKYLLNLEKTNK